MKITVTKTAAQEIESDALIWPVYQKPEKLPKELAAMGVEVAGALARAWDVEDFTGKLPSVWTVHTGNAQCPRVLLIGLGTRKSGDLESVRRAFGRAGRRLSKIGVRSAAVMLPSVARTKSADVAEAAVTGLRLGGYYFGEYRTADKRPPASVDNLTICVTSAKEQRSVEHAAHRAVILCEAALRVRDLVNTPANDLYPESYAKIAQQWCKDSGVTFKALAPTEITKENMRAVMAVGGGSERPPRFLILEYRGNKRKKGIDVVLVGKGVTFDTGGISLKPNDRMWEMRGDMKGSAVVLTTTVAAAKLKLPVNVVALMPLVENMPSGHAYRPGDIVRTMSGLTVEIMSTDAEGRMILADALTYAQRYKADAVVDIATLTGAMEVALGHVRAGLFGNDDKVMRRVEKASEVCGERVWRMPMDPEYEERIKSIVADMKNSGGRPGGSSVAARFLMRFVGDSKWAHIDIANMDNAESDRDYIPEGPTGFGARLLIEFLTASAQKRQA